MNDTTDTPVTDSSSENTEHTPTIKEAIQDVEMLLAVEGLPDESKQILQGLVLLAEHLLVSNEEKETPHTQDNSVNTMFESE